jgi:hypothetical protein
MAYLTPSDVPPGTRLLRPDGTEEPDCCAVDTLSMTATLFVRGADSGV